MLRAMNIALDARWIFRETSGIGQHTRMLIRGLAELNTDHRFRLVTDDPDWIREVQAGLACDWPLLEVPYGLFDLRNQWELVRRLRRGGVDLYHSTNYMMPLWGVPRHRRGPLRTVATLHDLIPMVFRDHAPKSKKRRLYPMYAELMRQVAARADALITVSESSKRDVIERLRLPASARDKVRVVYNGLEPVFFEDHDVPRHQPPEILYVGRLDPYKNVPQLVSAFAESMRRLPVGTRLRIIGPPDERYPEAMNLARQLDLFPYMDWEGHVSFPVLLEAYRRASVLVLPSEYEGFGLPVAEAMACGTPVICSEASSLPEVGGDAPRYVPPGDLYALVDALIEVLGDPDRQRDMVDKGKKQAAKFRMDAMARDTLAVYEATA